MAIRRPTRDQPSFASLSVSILRAIVTSAPTATLDYFPRWWRGVSLLRLREIHQLRWLILDQRHARHRLVIAHLFFVFPDLLEQLPVNFLRFFIDEDLLLVVNRVFLPSQHSVETGRPHDFL